MTAAAMIDHRKPGAEKTKQEGGNRAEERETSETTLDKYKTKAKIKIIHYFSNEEDLCCYSSLHACWLGNASL